MQQRLHAADQQVRGERLGDVLVRPGGAACNDAATRKQAARAGALSLLGKPFNADDLIGLLREALAGA